MRQDDFTQFLCHLGLRGEPSVDLFACIEVSGRKLGGSFWHRFGLRRCSCWQQKREFPHASPVVLRNNVFISPRPRVRTRAMLKCSRIDQQERNMMLLRRASIALQPPHEVIVGHGPGLWEPAQLEYPTSVIIGHDTKPVVKKLCLHVSSLLSSVQRAATACTLQCSAHADELFNAD